MPLLLLPQLHQDRARSRHFAGSGNVRGFDPNKVLVHSQFLVRYEALVLIFERMSATASALGFAPTFPLPCKRTLTLPASRSRGPITSMVWTLDSSAFRILPFILSLPGSRLARTICPRNSSTIPRA